MEWLEPFLPLIILAIYFLSWLRKQSPARRHTPPQPGRPASPPVGAAPPSVPTAAPTSFEDLLRQIQRAAEEAKQAEAVRRAQDSAPPPVPVAPPVPLAPKPAFQSGSEFREVGAFAHEEHGFDPSNPFSEEGFEHLARGADVTAHAPGHLGYDPHGLLGGVEAEAARPHPLVERLRRPGSARDAFALREILDPPRARRPFR